MPANVGGHRLAFRPDIEGVRGIAVLMVVAFHAGVPAFGGGFAGVDVFFVLSGYLITRLLVDEATAHGRIDLVGFYARRARRLLPAAALMILVTLIVSWLVLSPITLRGLAASAGTAATYWSNLYFAYAAGDYFGQDLASNPFLHTWSLAVEEQFYLVWPLLILVAVWFGSRRKGGLLTVIVVVTAASFALNLWMTEHLREWAFFSSPTRAWQFGAGAIAALFSTRSPSSTNAWGAALGWVGIGALALSAAGIDESMRWPGHLALLPTVGTVLVLHSGVLAPAARLPRLLAAAPLQFLGRLSYTWYLWHWPALVLAEAAAGPFTLIARLAVALGSLLLSSVTYRLVENPLRFHPRLLPAPRRSLVVMMTLSLVAAGAATATRMFAVTTDRQERYLAALDDVSASSSDGCNLPFTATTPARDCVYGVPESEMDVVLIGDSHATMWFPALEQLARERGWRLVVHAKSSCGLEDMPATRNDGAPYRECDEWRGAVLRELEQLRPELVIATMFATDTGAAPRSRAAALARGLTRIAETASVAVYLRDVPNIGFDAPMCLSALGRWSGRQPCTFDRAAALAVNAWEVEAVQMAAVPSIDLADEICSTSTCVVENGDIVMYRDSHHITASFAESLSDELGEALDGVVGSLAAQ